MLELSASCFYLFSGVCSERKLNRRAKNGNMKGRLIFNFILLYRFHFIKLQS